MGGPVARSHHLAASHRHPAAVRSGASGLAVSTYEDDDGRCEDRSEFEQEEFEADRAAEIDRCRAQPYGGDYVKNLVAEGDVT